jgi:AcrR family transcriptional regulator
LTEVGRRDEVIAAAIELLRESGPSALTSVNVAERLGVTQSAIYRHIDDMDELITISSQRVVDDLSSVMMAAVASPETTWGEGTHLAHFAERVVGIVAEHGQAIATIERWRYEEGPLGEGIRTTLDIGAQLIASELERAWRADFGVHEPFDAAATAAQLAHARIQIDDVIAVARQVSDTGPAQRRLIARTLGLRLFAGWCGYVLEMNTRVGIPIPELGGPTLSSPEYSLS